MASASASSRSCNISALDFQTQAACKAFSAPPVRWCVITSTEARPDRRAFAAVSWLKPAATLKSHAVSSEPKAVNTEESSSATCSSKKCACVKLKVRGLEPVSCTWDGMGLGVEKAASAGSCGRSHWAKLAWPSPAALEGACPHWHCTGRLHAKRCRRRHCDAV